MKTNWFVILIRLLLFYLIPPVLFVIGNGMIFSVAFKAETSLGFWSWVVIDYFFMVFCLTLFYLSLRKMVDDLRNLTGQK